MAIHGTRSEIKVGATHGVRTDLLTWMNNGTVSGESNKLTSSIATGLLGKSLSSGGNAAFARAIPMATLSREKAV